MAHDPVYSQPHFRIRSDDSQTLNADAGWANDLDSNATIDAGKRFRVRFEVEETAGYGNNNSFKIQYQKNGTGGFIDCTVSDDFSTGATPIQVTWSRQFANGDATTNILSGSASAFVSGVAVEGAANSNSTAPDSSHTEIEFALVMHNVYTTTNQNSDNDTFELRLVENSGTAFAGTYTNPTITLNMPTRLLGGVYVETPGRIGPFCDTNGNLYFFLEASAAISNGFYPTAMKSTDGGDSWTIVDGANCPTEGDTEALDIKQEGDTLHMCHNQGGDAYYHAFRTSDHSTNPDTWETVDTVLVTGVTAPNNQVSAIEVRSDGDVVAFYNYSSGTDTGLFYKINTGGGFGSEQTVDNESGYDCTGFVVVRGASDLIHIFYKMTGASTGPVYHRSLSSADSLSARETIDSDVGIGANGDRNPFTEAVYWDSSGNEKIMVVYKDADDLIYSVVVTNDGTPESRKAVSTSTVAQDWLSSDQVQATLTLDGSTAHVLWSDETSADIYRDEADNDGGWGTDTEVQDAVSCGFIRAMSFTHNSGNGGATVIGYVWDFDSDFSAGEAGFIRYDEHVLAAGGRTTKNTDSHPLGLHTAMGWRIGNP